jgi:hypothetical protein
MAKKRRPEDTELKQGELIRRRSPEAVLSGKVGIFERLLSTPSKWPFLNRFTKASVESATGVAEAQNKLVIAMKELGVSCQELDDVKIINEKTHDIRVREAMEAAAQLEEARWKEAARKKDKEIFDINKAIELEIAKQRKQYEVETGDLTQRKNIAELRKAVADLEKPEPPEKKTRGSDAARKQAEITKEVGRYEKEKEKIEKSDKSDAAKKTLLKAATITYQKTINAIEEKYK